MLVNFPWKERLIVIPLAEASDMTFVRTLPGRIVGFGSFFIEKPGRRDTRARSGTFLILNSYISKYVVCSFRSAWIPSRRGQARFPRIRRPISERICACPDWLGRDCPGRSQLVPTR